MSFERAFAAAGIGAMATVGTYALVSKSPTTYVLVAEDNSEKSAQDYSDKIGKILGYFLVAADNEEANEKWWNESFGKWKGQTDRSGLSDEFGEGKANRGFAKDSDADSEKALNRICKALYKGEKTTIEGNSDGENKKKRNSIFKYCSPLGEEPKTVASANDPYTNDASIGAIQKDKLISTRSSGNGLYWELKTREFLAGAEPDDSARFFKKFHKDKKESPASNKTLGDRCEEGYLKAAADTSSETDPTSDEVTKYCTLLGS